MRITPRKAINAYCKWCMGDEHQKICNIPGCVFYRFRSGSTKGQRPAKCIKRSPVKSIRSKCLECVETISEVKGCEMKECVLWKFRGGKDPDHGLKGVTPSNGMSFPRKAPCEKKYDGLSRR